MRRLAEVAGVLWLGLGSMGAGASDAHDGARVHVTARLYDSAALRPESRAGAAAEAGAILGAAGLDVQWLDCSPPVGPAVREPCARVPDRAEVVVRILGTSAPGRPGEPLPLGYALVDPRRELGVLATVYLDRVTILAGVAGAEPTRLLGRAVAHELTHLLIGRNEHGTHGLMRPVWSSDDVRLDRPDDWQLHPTDARAALAAIARRAGPRQASRPRPPRSEA
ncbi:MAG: hypothetical protein AB7G23_01365 [Vicinamibacterales bacterium]